MKNRRWFSTSEFSTQTGYKVGRIYQLINDKIITPKNTRKKGKYWEIRLLEALKDISENLSPRNRNHTGTFVELMPTESTKAPAPPPLNGKGSAVDKCGFATMGTREAQGELSRQKAAEAKIKNDVAMGKLIDVDEAEKRVFDCVRLVRDTVLDIPDRVAAAIACMTNEHEVNETLTKELTQSLEALAELINED